MPQAHSLPIEALLREQRLTAEVTLSGRLASLLNDENPTLRVHRLSGRSHAPGPPPLDGGTDAFLAKARLPAVAPLAEETAVGDEFETVRRRVQLSGDGYTVTGEAEFGSGSAPEMHGELLLKDRFIRLVGAVFTVHGGERQESRPLLYVNRDLLSAIVLY